MQFNVISTIVLLTTSASFVAAAVPGAVYLCSQTNWSGTCKEIVVGLGTCQQSAQAFGSTINSLGPNNQTICIGFKNLSCTGNPTWGFAFPGDATAGVAAGVPWNNNLLSFQCYDTNPYD